MGERMGAERFRPAVHDVLRTSPATERRYLAAVMEAGLEYDANWHSLVDVLIESGLDEAQAHRLADALIEVRDRT